MIGRHDARRALCADPGRAARNAARWPSVVPPRLARAASCSSGADGNLWLAGQRTAAISSGHERRLHRGPLLLAEPVRDRLDRGGSREPVRRAGSTGLSRGGEQLSAPFAVTQAPAIVDPLISADGRRVALWTASTVCCLRVPATRTSTASRSPSADPLQPADPAGLDDVRAPGVDGKLATAAVQRSGTLNYADLGAPRLHVPGSAGLDYHNAATEGLRRVARGRGLGNGSRTCAAHPHGHRRRFVIELFSGPEDVASGDLELLPARRCRRCADRRPRAAAAERRRGDPRMRRRFSSISFSPGATARSPTSSRARPTSRRCRDLRRRDKIIGGAAMTRSGARRTSSHPRLSIVVCSPHASIRGLAARPEGVRDGSATPAR